MSGIPGRGGPKPKPIALHLIRGTKPRVKRARVGAEPVAPGRLTDPPRWLGRSQKRLWRYAIQNAPHSLLRRIDSSLLAAWVIACDLHRQAAQKVAQSDTPMQSPYLAIEHKQALIMIRTAAELGFTPSARSRIAIGGTDPQYGKVEDPGEEFFRT
jgi:P27 family predicted phage terminase small subunit